MSENELPDNSYICLTAENEIYCAPCEKEYTAIVIALEAIWREEIFVGIDAVCRFDPCGHIAPGVSADWAAIAAMLDHCEEMVESGELEEVDHGDEEQQ